MNMRGDEGRQAEWVREFADALVENRLVPVRLWDERLTTVEAARVLRSSGIGIEKRAARHRPAFGGDPAAELSRFAMNIRAPSCCVPGAAGCCGRIPGLPRRMLPTGLSGEDFRRDPAGHRHRRESRELLATPAWCAPGGIFAWRVSSDRERKLQAGEYRFDQPAAPIEVYERIARGDIYYHRTGSAGGQEHVRHRRAGRAARPVSGGGISGCGARSRR